VSAHHARRETCLSPSCFRNNKPPRSERASRRSLTPEETSGFEALQTPLDMLARTPSPQFDPRRTFGHRCASSSHTHNYGHCSLTRGSAFADEHEVAQRAS
jgi:hypothetical protein